MSERIEQSFFLFLLAAIAVLGWGLLELNKAGGFQPVAPVKAAPNTFNFQRKVAVYPLTRYQILLSGDLFFGKAPPPPALPAAPKIEFVSQLIVLGITKGVNAQDGYAVVGVRPTGDKQTWIAKVGMAIEGEQILQIRDGYLIVRNKTGTGKVLLRN